MMFGKVFKWVLLFLSDITACFWDDPKWFSVGLPVSKVGLLSNQCSRFSCDSHTPQRTDNTASPLIWNIGSEVGPVKMERTDFIVLRVSCYMCWEHDQFILIFHRLTRALRRRRTASRLDLTRCKVKSMRSKLFWKTTSAKCWREVTN